MKQQQTTQSASWVSPQPLVMEQPSAKPTHKGEISTGRILGFLLLSFVVAIAVSYLTWSAWGVNMALAVFVLVLLSTFSPFYLMDSMLSSGYLHRRSELSIDSARVDLEIIRAAQLNEAQDLAIRALQKDVTAIKKQIANLRTIEIRDRDGSRTVSLRDEVDTAIDVWLTQTMFDVTGRLVGAHPSGVIRDKYPFGGKGEDGRAANVRLQSAGLVKVRQPGNQYAWSGPTTLHEAMDALAPLRGDEDEYTP